MNNLEITENEFLQLPNKQQHLLLFKNSCNQNKIISGYKFYQKISALIGGVLVAGMAILFQSLLNR